MPVWPPVDLFVKKCTHHSGLASRHSIWELRDHQGRSTEMPRRGIRPDCCYSLSMKSPRRILPKLTKMVWTKYPLISIYHRTRRRLPTRTRLAIHPETKICRLGQRSQYPILRMINLLQQFSVTRMNQPSQDCWLWGPA